MRIASEVHSRKRVALTFDDRPCEARTSALLDVLARYLVLATFFLIGEHAERHPGLVRQIVSAGHAIGNHMFTHQLLVNAT